MASPISPRSRQTLIYGLALAALLILLKWLEWRFIIFDHAIELYSGAIAIIFTGLGIWLALKLAKPKVTTVVIEKEAAPPPSAAPAQSILSDTLLPAIGA